MILLDLLLGMKVSAALVSDPRVDAFGVTVRARRGRVILEGRVDTEEQRLAAEETALTVPGVLDVVNDIVVARSEDGQRIGIL